MSEQATRLLMGFSDGERDHLRALFDAKGEAADIPPESLKLPKCAPEHSISASVLPEQARRFHACLAAHPRPTIEAILEHPDFPTLLPDITLINLRRERYVQYPSSVRRQLALTEPPHTLGDIQDPYHRKKIAGDLERAQHGLSCVRTHSQQLADGTFGDWLRTCIPLYTEKDHQDPSYLAAHISPFPHSTFAITEGPTLPLPLPSLELHRGLPKQFQQILTPYCERSVNSRYMPVGTSDVLLTSLGPEVGRSCIALEFHGGKQFDYRHFGNRLSQVFGLPQILRTDQIADVQHRLRIETDCLLAHHLVKQAKTPSLPLMRNGTCPCPRRGGAIEHLQVPRLIMPYVTPQGHPGVIIYVDPLLTPTDLFLLTD